MSFCTPDIFWYILKTRENKSLLTKQKFAVFNQVKIEPLSNKRVSKYQNFKFINIVISARKYIDSWVTLKNAISQLALGFLTITQLYFIMISYLQIHNSILLEYYSRRKSDWSIIIWLEYTKPNLVVYNVNSYSLDRYIKIKNINNNNAKNLLPQ